LKYFSSLAAIIPHKREKKKLKLAANINTMLSCH
jgi:hypothetical protein